MWYSEILEEIRLQSRWAGYGGRKANLHQILEAIEYQAKECRCYHVNSENIKVILKNWDDPICMFGDSIKCLQEKDKKRKYPYPV